MSLNCACVKLKLILHFLERAVTLVNLSGEAATQQLLRMATESPPLWNSSNISNDVEIMSIDTCNATYESDDSAVSGLVWSPDPF